MDVAVQSKDTDNIVLLLEIKTLTGSRHKLTQAMEYFERYCCDDERDQQYKSNSCLVATVRGDCIQVYGVVGLDLNSMPQSGVELFGESSFVNL